MYHNSTTWSRGTQATGGSSGCPTLKWICWHNFLNLVKQSQTVFNIPFCSQLQTLLHKDGNPLSPRGLHSFIHWLRRRHVASPRWEGAFCYYFQAFKKYSFVGYYEVDNDSEQRRWWRDGEWRQYRTAATTMYDAQQTMHDGSVPLSLTPRRLFLPSLPFFSPHCLFSTDINFIRLYKDNDAQRRCVVSFVPITSMQWTSGLLSRTSG